MTKGEVRRLRTFLSKCPYPQSSYCTIYLHRNKSPRLMDGSKLWDVYPTTLSFINVDYHTLDVYSITTNCTLKGYYGNVARRHNKVWIKNVDIQRISMWIRTFDGEVRYF